MKNELLETLKKELDSYQGIRTVKIWNELREQVKEKYSQQTINELDSSGFIHEWVRQWV